MSSGIHGEFIWSGTILIAVILPSTVVTGSFWPANEAVGRSSAVAELRTATSVSGPYSSQRRS
jgi:hypothetical protein